MAEEHLLDRAAALLQLRRPEQAEQVLADVFDTDPDHPRALRLLSWAHRIQGRPDQLPRAAEQAVAAAPEDARGWEELARAHAACDRRTDAVGAAERACELAPHDPDVLVLLAALLLGIDDHRALRLADAALAIDQGSAEAFRVRAGALERLGRVSEASAALGTALRLAPTDELAHHDLSSRLRREGRTEAAEDVLRRGLRADPQSAVLRGELQWQHRLGQAGGRVGVRLVVTLLVVALCVVCLLLGAPRWLRAALLTPVVVLDLLFWFRDGLWREAAEGLRLVRAAPTAIRRKIWASAPVALVVPLVLLLLVPYGTALLPFLWAVWTAAAGGLLALALFVVGRVLRTRQRAASDPDRPLGQPGAG